MENKSLTVILQFYLHIVDEAVVVIFYFAQLQEV